jgi:hypothetical protein
MLRTDNSYSGIPQGMEKKPMRGHSATRHDFVLRHAQSTLFEKPGNTGLRCNIADGTVPPIMFASVLLRSFLVAEPERKGCCGAQFDRFIGSSTR